MKITEKQLRRVMPLIERNLRANRHFRGMTVGQVAELMNKYAEEFDIITPLQWVHYLAQVAHESAQLRYTEELASGAAYDTGKLAQRLGNTPEKDSDGQKYKGRGLIQLTGRSNYEAYKRYCGYDVVKEPELLAKPVGAIRSSMWFWKQNGLNALADRDDIVAITKRINGGTNHLYERREYMTQAKKVIAV